MEKWKRGSEYTAIAIDKRDRWMSKQKARELFIKLLRRKTVNWLAFTDTKCGIYISIYIYMIIVAADVALVNHFVQGRERGRSEVL